MLFLILSILLITGCNQEKEKQVTSIIKKENNIAIAIHYPKFQYPKLDHQIKKEIDSISQEFHQISSKEKELNIDYKYNILNNRFINVQLLIYIHNKKEYHQVKNFHYDIKKKKLLTLKDMINEEELKKLVPKIKTILTKQYSNYLVLDKLNETITTDFSHYLQFYFDDNDFTFYFDSDQFTKGYYNIICAKISLDLINLTIPLERGMFQEEDVILPTKKHEPIDQNKPMIALTFDDGPSKYTDSIIELLKKYDARATFFVIGNKVKLYQKTMLKMVRYGNEIGNHSYNHKWLTKVSDDELVNQINTTQNIIQETTGLVPKLFRPTYGSINQHLREKISLDIIMWTVDTSDWKTTNSKKIASYTLKTIKNNDIILMHDTHKQTYEALKIMLPKLKEQGYQFVTVSELNEILATH